LETELGEALNDKEFYLKSDRGMQLVNPGAHKSGLKFIVTFTWYDYYTPFKIRSGDRFFKSGIAVLRVPYKEMLV
jgi:hypothetical protein